MSQVHEASELVRLFVLHSPCTRGAGCVLWVRCLGRHAMHPIYLFVLTRPLSLSLSLSEIRYLILSLSEGDQRGTHLHSSNELQTLQPLAKNLDAAGWSLFLLRARPRRVAHADIAAARTCQHEAVRRWHLGCWRYWCWTDRPRALGGAQQLRERKGRDHLQPDCIKGRSGCYQVQARHVLWRRHGSDQPPGCGSRCAACLR